MRVVLAVDLGATRTRVGVLDREGNLRAYEAFPTRGQEGPERVLRRVWERLQGLLEGLPGAEPVALGLSLASPVERDTGRMRNPPNLPGWDGVAPQEVLGRWTPLPVVSGNDATLAALGEVSFGAAVGARHLVYLTWSSGIGGGLVVEGRVVEGATGLAGEVGHLVVAPDGPPCACGGRGCLEAVASGLALARQARSAVEAGAQGPLRELSGGDPERVDARLVAEAMRRGDPLARRLMEEAARYLGIGIAMLYNALDPEVLVLGGGVARDLDLVREVVEGSARRHAIAAQKGRIRILPSRLGDRVALLGAGARAWQAAEGG